jgi:hypothetical protein
MKVKNFNNLKPMLLLLVVILTSFNCNRELSDDATEANFSKTGEIFTDDFLSMGTDFYFPYAGSKQTAFSVDREQGYNSNASIRIDVPNANDPDGNYAGAIFRVDGAPRDLSGYDALTFWAKSTQGVVIGEFGFGEDFLSNKYLTT